jgi:RND family efflux transporter MFP subunit
MSPRYISKSTPATIIALACAGAIILGVTGVLHARNSNDDIAQLRAPMPVLSVIYEIQDGYVREQRFLGLVQAGARSQVGFEVPGAIDEILVKEGQTVAAGDPLAILNTQNLAARRDAALARVNQVSAELELARARSERQAPLKNSGAISAQTYDDTRLAEKATLSALAAARAQMAALDVELAKSTLRAPYAARVGQRLLDRGAVTQPGMPVFTLVSTGDREAHIGVAVEQAGFLEPGRGYDLLWRGETQQATLRGIRPDVNPVSMTTDAIFDLPPSLLAFDGEPVAISLPRKELDTGGWLPLSALLEGERGVWTVLALRDGSAGHVALREVVEVLHVSGDRAFVRGTLRNGDRVISDGVHRIAPGTRVSLVHAAADPVENQQQIAVI